MVAGGGDVVGRRAEPADHGEVAAVGEQCLHECAPLHHLVHTLRPISRCESRIATERSPENAMSAPAPTMSSTSAALSTR